MNGAMKEASSPITSLMLAGIWEIAEYKGDSRIAFAILTDEPNELVASYHDRMPLALTDDKVDAWLDLSIEPPLDEKLLLDLKEFAVRPMDRALKNVRQKKPGRHRSRGCGGLRVCPGTSSRITKFRKAD